LPEYPSVVELLTIHAILIDEFGGTYGVSVSGTRFPSGT